jgi:hypothetical protein
VDALHRLNGSENGTDRLALYGSLDITRDKAGRRNAYANGGHRCSGQALSMDSALPEHQPPADKPKAVHIRSPNAGRTQVRVGPFRRDVCSGWGGSGVQLAIARTHRRAFSLSVIPGKCRRSSTTADSSPLSSNTCRMVLAVVSSTLNIAPTWVGEERPASQSTERPAQASQMVEHISARTLRNFSGWRCT